MAYKILLHGGISGRGRSHCGSGGSSRGRSAVSSRSRLEVVTHLGVELGNRLLDRTGIAATALLTGGTLLGGTLLVLLLLGGSRLGLSLRLGSTLRKSLDRRDNLVGLSSSNNNLDLHKLASVFESKPFGGNEP